MIESKICKKCLICKDINQFRLKGKYYLNTCKDCEKQYGKEYYEDNKEKIKEQKKEYYINNKEQTKEQNKEYKENNKERLKTQNKEYYKNNKEQIKEYKKEYYENNKEKLKEQKKGYYENNKEKVKEKQKEYKKERRQNDPFFVLRQNFSTLFNKNLKNMSLSKNGNSCFDILDYNFDKLKTNLESKFEPWMNWSNYGKYDPKTWKDDDPSTHTWNLDHIDPQANLPYKSFEDENFKKCWGLDNLRPYSAKQNFLDGVSRVRHKKKKE